MQPRWMLAMKSKLTYLQKAAVDVTGISKEKALPAQSKDGNRQGPTNQPNTEAPAPCRVLQTPDVS